MNKNKALLLENDFIQMRILPHLGGNILSVFHKKSKTEILWNKNGLSREGSFDSSWFGGLDVMFPNDLPYRTKELNYPDHGVIWDKKMDYKEHHHAVELHSKCTVTDCSIRINVSLEHNQISLKAIIANLGDRTIPYLFRFHPAFIVDNGDQLTMKPKKCYVDQQANAPKSKCSEFQWPYLLMEDGEILDVSTICSKKIPREIFHHYALGESKFSIDRVKRGIQVQCKYSEALNYLTYYGALRMLNDSNICVLEPATSIPADLSAAIENESAKYLEPHAEVAYFMTLTIV